MAFFLSFFLILLDAAVVEKSSKSNPSIPDMVNDAFAVLGNRMGLTLAAIYKHVAKKLETHAVSKLHMTLIKKYLTEKFEDGHIRMVNADAVAKIKFNPNSRFALVE